MTHGIEQTIERVEDLYRAVTGREPPPPGPIPAPGEIEAQVSLRVDRLLGLLEPSWTPAVTLVGAAGEVVVRADLPGVARQDVRAELQGDVLVLRGERRAHDRDPGAGPRETPVGPFLRTVRLPGVARPDRISARLADGVLEVRVLVEPIGPAPIDVV